MGGGVMVSGVGTGAVDGLTVLTFAEGGVHRFPSRGKRARAVEFVIHETVTRSVDSTIAVLKKRGLSVHLVMARMARSRSTATSRRTSSGMRASTTARRSASRS